MWFDLWVALALLLVLEGLLPALAPATFRKALWSMVKMDERTLRITGLLSMVLGALLLYWLKN